MKKSLGASPVGLTVPTWVVATYGPDGKPNAMTAAWVGICCSKPAALCVSLRAATKSHGHITERKAFTVNVPSADFIRQADFCGMGSGRDFDKFDLTGLTAVQSDLVDAPYIAEFPVVVECRVTQVHELGLHTQFIGEIVDVKADESVLTEEGHVDAAKAMPAMFTAGTRSYHAPGEFIGQAFSVGKEYLKK